MQSLFTILEGEKASIDRYLRKRVSDEHTCNDISQEVALRTLLPLPDIVHPLSYLYRIVDHCIADYFRRRTKLYYLSFERLDEMPAKDETTSFEHVSQIDHALNAAAQLPPTSENAFLDYYWHGKKLCDIARERGVSSSCMKLRMYRARKKVRSAILQKSKHRNVYISKHA